MPLTDHKAFPSYLRKTDKALSGSCALCTEGTEDRGRYKLAARTAFVRGRLANANMLRALNDTLKGCVVYITRSGECWSEAGWWGGLG